jgi:hypothetical protein
VFLKVTSLPIAKLFLNLYVLSCKPIHHCLVGKFYLVDVGYACRPRFLPLYRGIRYHLSEYGPRHNPTNAKELYNLRHSSSRVTIERAFGALKNHFRIIDDKTFHKYKTQVKLVQACCILHNWILGFGVDAVVLTKAEWVANPTSSSSIGPPINSLQSQEVPTMASVRDEISHAMWESRGSSRT